MRMQYSETSEKTLNEGFSDRRNRVHQMGVTGRQDYEKMIRMMFRPGRSCVYGYSAKSTGLWTEKSMEKQLLAAKDCSAIL